jgi:hypothetical protein
VRVYNPAAGGTAWVELANGKGGWTGVSTCCFSSGWNVSTGVFKH